MIRKETQRPRHTLEGLTGDFLVYREDGTKELVRAFRVVGPFKTEAGAKYALNFTVDHCYPLATADEFEQWAAEEAKDKAAKA